MLLTARDSAYKMETHVKKPDPWRLIVRLKSRRVLNEYIEFHKISGRELARRANQIAKKADPNDSVGPAIVNHLRSGFRDTCNLVTARAIEEALQCPPGFLFEQSVSRVADSTRQSRRISA